MVWLQTLPIGRLAHALNEYIPRSKDCATPPARSRLRRQPCLAGFADGAQEKGFERTTSRSSSGPHIGLRLLFIDLCFFLGMAVLGCLLAHIVGTFGTVVANCLQPQLWRRLEPVFWCLRALKT